MGIFDGWGREPAGAPVAGQGAAASDDERAIERYRYLLRTAPPETIEAAHAEAFTRLTPGQRRRVLDGIASALPERERGAAADALAGPAELARYATRAEVRRPGVLERALSAAPAGPGLGSMFAGTLAGSLAGTVLGSLYARQFFAHDPAAMPLYGADGGTMPDAPAGPGEPGGFVTAGDAGPAYDDGGFDAGAFDV